MLIYEICCLDRQRELSEKLAFSNQKSSKESRKTLEQRMAKAKEQRNKIYEEKQDRLRLQRTKVTMNFIVQ